MLLIKIENRKRRLKLNKKLCLSLLEWLGLRAKRLASGDGARWSEVSVICLDNRSMRRANRAVFGKDETTDVITLKYDPLPGFESESTAEILVNLELAYAEGERRARVDWGPSFEFALYLAHGMDHLAGFDDADPADKRRMRARELRWVRAAEMKGLVGGLLPERLAEKSEVRE